MKNLIAGDQGFELWVLLRQVGDTIIAARETELNQYGITARQAAILFCIQAIGEEATPADIARWQLRKSHSISGILSRMEKQGLVRKSKDLDRKNLVRIVMTKKGQEAYHQSLKRESMHKIMSCLSEEERQQLRSYLTKLRSRALAESGKVSKPPFPPSQ